MEMKIYNLQIELERSTNALDQTTLCVAELREQLSREKLAYTNLQQELTRTQEHMEALQKHSSRSLLNDTKIQLHDMMERVQKLQMETSEAAVKRSEMERERVREQELNATLRSENTELMKTIRGLEEETLTLRREIQKLQVSKMNIRY
ncbi:unnamed protein product [Trichobilharzia regenti]|nr:unnamed protein product [Trichobilharzia regenti]